MSADPLERRVLVLTPLGRDTALACASLSDAGILAAPCDSLPMMAELLQDGAGTLLIAEEVLHEARLQALLDVLERQSPWSDIPIIVLTPGHSLGRSVGLERLGRHGILLLERPTRIVVLISTVESALRARLRQYQVRDLLAESAAAVRQRDEFLAMLGHELRNPLGAIRNALYLQERKADAGTALDLRLRAVIQHQSALLVHIIDDLLDVARVTTGKIVLESLPIDLRDIVDQCVKAIEPAVEAQRHRLSVVAPDRPATIIGDPVRIEQVVMNLLSNSVKYTPKGGQIWLELGIEGDLACIRVRDNGIGIDPAMLPRVFDLFTQVGTSIDRSRGGLGIGLTVVRRLVELHGGRIEATSEGPGLGSAFTVRLPLAPQTAPEANAAPGTPTAVSRHVLVIEDNLDTRETLMELLRMWGHRVEAAVDGPGGVDLASKSLPEIALIDVGLPGLDGYEVARALRALEGGDRLFLVALTGYGQPQDRQRALEAGFDMHFVKPMDLERLERLLSAGMARTEP